MDRVTSQPLHDLPGDNTIPVGQCVLDLGRGELFTSQGERVALRPKALELLCVLGAHAGEVIGKDALMLRIWPDVVVTEDSLTQLVAEIRRCIGDQRREWLHTVPRRGYTLVRSALPTALLPPSRLPARDTAMHGRDDDVAQLAAMLRPGALVTILGAGGIGKTRLALELAHRAFEFLEGPASWVDLAPAGDDAQVLPLVASALGVQASGAAARAQLAAALAPRRGMLVLDNCEHRVNVVAGLVQALRDGAPGMTWLATSQTPLQLHAEQSYRLGTLEVPEPSASLDAARRCGAIALLEQRARVVDQRFALDSASLPRAIAICRRLDGVALALEMAAARLPALGVGGVHAMLGARLDRLSSERRDAAPRQRSLLATLDWSCSLLTDAQHHALQALASFAGRFDAGSACEVIGSDDALDILCALVDKSLVSVESTEPRHYRLLESMRLFARDRLRQSTHAAAALTRHRHAMARVARQFDKDCAQGRNDALLWRYLPLSSDLKQAFDNACQEHDADAAAMLLDALRMLDAMRGVHIALEDRLRAVLPLLPAASRTARARICLVVASCGWIKLPGLSAACAAAQAVDALRGKDNARWPLQRALLLLAIEQARLGDTVQANVALDEACTLVRPDDLLERRAIVQSSASYVAAFAGDNTGALARMERACELAHLAGAPSTLDYAMSNMSSMALSAGDVEAARRHARRAVQRARERHTPVFLAAGLAAAIEAELAAGEWSAARQLVVEAIERARESGTLATFAGTYATLALRIGEFETGCRLLGWSNANDPIEPNRLGRARAQEQRALLLGAEAALGMASVQRLLELGASMAQTELVQLALTLGASAQPREPTSRPRASLRRR